MDVVLGVDGGNSKTELVAANVEGACLAFERGPGSNSHGIGADGAAAVITELARRSGVDLPAKHAVCFLCGADGPGDIADLENALGPLRLADDLHVDNDTFALLRAGSDAAEAIAVICGSGTNVVGRSGGRVLRYPSLGWETGDWGGGESIGREALFLAARAEDGRGAPTVLADLVCGHFGTDSVAALGADVHYRRIPEPRLRELAPLVVEAAAHDDVALGIVERQAAELSLLVERALRDLELTEAEVVLGGGLLRAGEGPLHHALAARLPAGARVTVLRDAPVIGAVLAALDAAGASDAAKDRLREELRGR